MSKSTYFDNGMTFEELASSVGVSRATVQTWAKRFKIPPTSVDPVMIFSDIKLYRDDGWKFSEIKKEIKRLYRQEVRPVKIKKIEQVINDSLSSVQHFAIEIILEAPILNGRKSEKNALRKLLTEFMKGDS